MTRFLLYLFWNLFYLPQRRPRGLMAHVERGIRTRWPWRKFRPTVWHSDDGSFWEICFGGERAYTITGVRIPVNVNVQYSVDTGKVTGLKIYDSDLEQLAK